MTRIVWCFCAQTKEFLAGQNRKKRLLNRKKRLLNIFFQLFFTFVENNMFVVL